MKRRFLVIFSALALAPGLASAEACVKVRKGEAYACMTFSAAARQDAASYGLQLAASFKASKQALLKRGWVLDQQWLSKDDAGSMNDRDMVCGSGWDAVCQTAFRKNREVLVLTLSGVNEGTPLVAAELERATPTVGFTRTLTTPSFIIRIKSNCAEGEVTCDDVSYEGASRKTGKRIKLRGKTLHSMCADRVTPCRFQGYAFRNGKTYYRVLEEGRLSVMQGKEVLLDERGKWR